MRQSNSREEPSSRDIQWELDRLESYIASLFVARSLCITANQETEIINSLLRQLEGKRDSLRASLTGGRLEPRHREKLPKGITAEARPKYTIFLDECGGHSKPVDGAFAAFCLCCLIVDNKIYEEILMPRWEGLKARFLKFFDTKTGKTIGRSSITHEPYLRPPKLRYRLRRMENGPELFEQELGTLISEVPFTLISAVVLKSEYYQIYGDAPVDRFLPSSIYNLCLNFIIERVVHFLSSADKGALGSVVAESRERREDALLQYEFVRLQLEGTQYVSPSWVRQQLTPTIEFKVKADNICGLQLVDLFARPVAEKIMTPETSISRWDLIKGKFYDGGQGRPESYGLKVFPTSVDSEIFL